MRIRVAVPLVAALLLAAGAAPAAKTSPSDLESAKHLTLLELYLRGAKDAAKALHVVGTAGATSADARLVGEIATRAVDEVQKAEIHLRHLKKLGASTGRIEFHVKKARAAVDRLSAFRATRGQLGPRDVTNLKVAAEHINAHVSDALRRVDTLAGEMGHATLEEIEVRERVPVKGRD